MFTKLFLFSAKKAITKKQNKANAKNKNFPATSRNDIDSNSAPKKKRAQTKNVKSKANAKSEYNVSKSENGYPPMESNSYMDSNDGRIPQKTISKKKTAKNSQSKKDKDHRKKSPIKLKLPKVPPTAMNNFDSSQFHNNFTNNPLSLTSQPAPIMLQDGLPLQSLLPKTPLPLSAITSPSPSNYDLTDRDSVRQLLSSRG